MSSSGTDGVVRDRPDMRMEFTAVNTIRNEKILVQEWFWDHAEALEAVGLRE